MRFIFIDIVIFIDIDLLKIVITDEVKADDYKLDVVNNTCINIMHDLHQNINRIKQQIAALTAQLKLTFVGKTLQVVWQFCCSDEHFSERR